MQKIAIIGGGAVGMACAVLLARKGQSVTIYERGERLGRKLSATGNGQGNVTNLNMGAEHYFSDDLQKVGRAVSRFSSAQAIAFLESMGGIFLPDARGRVYPLGRQASAVTDLFRRELARLGVEVVFNANIHTLTHKSAFELIWQNGKAVADKVILCAGGLASPNFGTDGSAYALAKGFSHTVTECSPALVQLKCDPAQVRGLKGIRVDACARVIRKNALLFECRGDVLFTESGLSGDAIFRASSYAKKGDTVAVDFLPDVSPDLLTDKIKGEDDLLCIVNNGLARALVKRANGDIFALRGLLKHFPVQVTGTLGYAYAQVTKGGIPLSQVDEHLQSTLQEGLYLGGEILNVDGECGGYNLQWAWTSAYLISEGIC